MIPRLPFSSQAVMILIEFRQSEIGSDFQKDRLSDLAVSSRMTRTD